MKNLELFYIICGIAEEYAAYGREEFISIYTDYLKDISRNKRRTKIQQATEEYDKLRIRLRSMAKLVEGKYIQEIEELLNIIEKWSEEKHNNNINTNAVNAIDGSIS